MDWFTLTLILSVIASTLILSMRAITADTNPFAFMAIVVGVAAVFLMGFCLYRQVPLALPPRTCAIAVLAGISVAVLDVAFILMFRAGAKVSVAMPLFRVCAILLSVLIGCSFLQETISPVKLSGILLACFSIYFLTSSSSTKGDA